jgi:hypothetical protein
MATTRVIPIKMLATGAAAAAEEAHARLERAGFMRMMALCEPRLSEFVTKYRALGYEVKVLPYEPEDAGTESGGEPGQSGGTIYVRKQNPPGGENGQS